MTTTTKHRCFIPEIEYYCRNCACVKKLRVGTCHGTSRTFGPGKDRGLSVRPLFYLSGPSDRRHLGKTESGGAYVFSFFVIYSLLKRTWSLI